MIIGKSACISHTDDYFQIYVFLLDWNGWKLYSAYDLNPNPQRYGVLLNISETDNSQKIELLIEVVHSKTRNNWRENIFIITSLAWKSPLT